VSPDRQFFELSTRSRASNISDEFAIAAATSHLRVFARW
jgi:hypothetical protein